MCSSDLFPSHDSGGPEGDGLYENGVRSGYGGYEYHDYKQAQVSCAAGNLRCSTDSRGSGVYMFDANNGDLLWYADSTNGENGIDHVKNEDLLNLTALLLLENLM